MTRIVICGCCGKMGRVINDVIKSRNDCEVIAGIDLYGDKYDNFPVVKYPNELTEKPDVIIDFGKAARACGLGETGLSGRIINKKYGPFMRYCFIIYCTNTSNINHIRFNLYTQRL